MLMIGNGRNNFPPKRRVISVKNKKKLPIEKPGQVPDHFYIIHYILVKSYCVKQKKQAECVPGSETTVRAKNDRLTMKCKCAEYGIKTKCIRGQTGGVSWIAKKAASTKNIGKEIGYLLGKIF